MLADGSIPADQIPAISRLLEIKLAQMDRLIEQMLDTARLEHDALDLPEEIFNLGSVVQEQIDVFRPLSEGRRLLLDGGELEVLAKGDRLRIATIVANLLDNALKYSPDGGDVQIRVGVRDSQAFISVRDTGLGIAPEHLPRLFTRFGRLPTNENATIPGTGLGLYLCKEIAIRHGGDVTVVSVPGAGSEFTLTLPACK